MPPAKKLPDAAIADFERWVREGAVWPQRKATDAFRPAAHGADHETHWAFLPVKKFDPPSDASGWSANAVDCFIHAGLAAHGLHPGAAASKRTLLRRAYFDLIGLPPTPQEVDAFLADKSPEAFANVVESLLGSPQYGERWGRYWMDVVRYADTAGDNADYPVPEAGSIGTTSSTRSMPTSRTTSSSASRLPATFWHSRDRPRNIPSG